METTTIRWDTTERHQGKYDNPNPLHQLSLNRFYNQIACELKAAAPQSILDFGCGEGLALDMLEDRKAPLTGYLGLDMRADALDAARHRHPGKRFDCANLFDPAYDDMQVDTVMALEVLEHLLEPEKALARLVAMTRNNLILSVPHEPWFQLANLVRGRDLIRLGNHPEHVQHWNGKTFAAFISEVAHVEKIAYRFPFVIAVARPL